MNRRLLLILPLALLTACGDSPEQDSRTASGEVLEGTISDAMLPLDTVQSQAPLAKAEAKKAAASETPQTPPASQGTTLVAPASVVSEAD